MPKETQLIVEGGKEIAATLRDLEKVTVRAARREIRRIQKPLVADLKGTAPVRSGKLRGSIKPFTSSSLEGGVQWGGKGGKAGERRFLAEYGEPGARGGTKTTKGRIEEAYYWAAVAKGRSGAGGKSGRPNKFIGAAVYKHIGTVQRDIARLLDRLGRDFSANRKLVAKR